MEILLTDIHTHIIPGVDDGSENMHESMEMIELAYETGIRRIVLTPHYISGGNGYEPEKLDRLYDELKKKIRSVHPDMELFLGNEVMYSSETAEDLRRGCIHTMNGTRYVLVEYLPEVPYRVLTQSMGELQRGGWWPVIAHVERYSCLMETKERINELIEMGGYLQMNTNSLTGSRFNWRTRKCRALVRENKISFLGTDAHGSAHRTPECKETLKWLKHALEKYDLERLLWGNADRMLHGEIIQ
ncbi:MAG: protein tyrosine phosphatase [Lachnospiraceae bacterium]|nr:protein tyrosine phosphatase [Lachnospiraceae bacterium]